MISLERTTREQVLKDVETICTLSQGDFDSNTHLPKAQNIARVLDPALRAHFPWQFAWLPDNAAAKRTADNYEAAVGPYVVRKLDSPTRWGYVLGFEPFFDRDRAAFNGETEPTIYLHYRPPDNVRGIWRMHYSNIIIPIPPFELAITSPFSKAERIYHAPLWNRAPKSHSR